MIPLTAVIDIRNKRGRGFHIWSMPLFLVWILLLPVALLLLPLFIVICALGQVNPLRALSVFWRILASLKGTHVEVEDSDRSILIHIP